MARARRGSRPAFLALGWLAPGKRRRAGGGGRVEARNSSATQQSRLPPSLRLLLRRRRLTICVNPSTPLALLSLARPPTGFRRPDVAPQKGGALKPTRNWRLSGIVAQSAALASRRKERPPPCFPERKSAAGGRRGGRRGSGGQAPLGHKLGLLYEADAGLVAFALRKKGRGQVEWSHMLLEIMNRSRPIARFAFSFIHFRV